MDGQRTDPESRAAGSARHEAPTRRIAYFVSRFPTTTETFVLRELNAVAADEHVKTDLYAMFPTPEGGVVQPAARPWLDHVHRPRLRSLPFDLLRWAVRRPVRLASSVALVVADHWRRPLTLLRALTTVPIAAQYATSVRKLGTEHIHAHFATYPALAAWFCRRLVGVPYSFTVHAHDLYMHQLGLKRRVADAAFVVSISEFNREALEELTPPEVPIHVIHCGVELAEYEYRARAPESDGAVKVLIVASLREKKGHRVLFGALASDPALERMAVEVVGDGPLREELGALAAKLGLDSRVRFHGNLTEPEVAKKLAEADVFVLPSIVERSGDTEGIPVALMEAMAAGVPVIASRLTGIPELVRDGETGLLVEPGDVDELAGKLAQVLAAPDAARGRAIAGRQLVEDQFELHSSARRLVGLFGGRPAERPRRRPALLRPPLVFAYHAIGEVPPELDPDRLAVPADELRGAIEVLLGRGYEFVTADEFARRLHAGESLKRVCALTFDDGSADNATVLPEILASFGVPATLFVCPGLLGHPHPWIAAEAGVRLMNREELDSVAKLDFIEIGSHTSTHADLGDATYEQALDEMVAAKRELEEMLDRPVPSFAFPYGHYSAACPAAAEAAGYTSAATCGLPGGWTPYELRRELMGPGDFPFRFELKARGLYRPIVTSPPMRLRRRLRAR
jgi:glycosyltransferase involved in cell wall biosynthesis/peptidoglycan/xylan/chitin deacetylase (PgdA/CDA1 family)